MSNIDTSILDNKEIINMLFKKSFEFPYTSKKKSWFEEININFNTNTLVNDLLIDKIPKIPDFDTSGIIRSAEFCKLVSGDFINYNTDSINISECSIVDDFTGTIRRYKNLKLDQIENTCSYSKKDICGNNIIQNSLQYNYNQYYNENNILIQPYLYNLYTERSLEQNNELLKNIPFGNKGGNWILNVKNGILVFNDFENLSNSSIEPNEILRNLYNINSNNKPVITLYKYIGKKGLNFYNNLINDISNNLYNIKYDIENIKYSQKSDNLLANSNIDYNYEKIKILENDNILFKNLLNDISYNLNNNNLNHNNLNNITSNIKSDIILANSNIDYNHEKIKILENITNNFYNQLAIIEQNLTNDYLTQDDFKKSIDNIVYNDSEILVEIIQENISLKSDLTITNSNINFNNEQMKIIEDKVNDNNNNVINSINELNLNMKSDLLVNKSNIEYNYQKIQILENSISNLLEKVEIKDKEILKHVNNELITLKNELFENKNILKGDTLLSNSKIEYNIEKINQIEKIVNNLEKNSNSNTNINLNNQNNSQKNIILSNSDNLDYYIEKVNFMNSSINNIKDYMKNISEVMNNSYNIFQIENKKIFDNDYIINNNNYKILISTILNLIVKENNSIFKIHINLNYNLISQSSINIGLFYKINNNEILINEFTLENNENINTKNTLNNSINIDLCNNKNNNIEFYVKVKNNSNNCNTNNSNNFSKILLSDNNNYLNIEELNKISNILIN